MENPEFGGFVARIVRAYGRRAGGDIEALADLAALRRRVDAELVEAARRLRDEVGHSEAEIAARLGVSQPAVHYRFFAQRDDEPAAPGGDEQRASVAC